jgi:dolichol-phosphate mannosyltransferase
MTLQRAEPDAGEMAKKTLSVVIPVYFNAESLPGRLAEIGAVEKELLSRSVRLQLIFVNDGSGDNSLQELLKVKRARPATKVISLSRNFGARAASKTGLKFVAGDAFMILAWRELRSQ